MTKDLTGLADHLNELTAHTSYMPQKNDPQTAPLALAQCLGSDLTLTRFVLVEPSHPGNVGAAARALKTMGFTRLVLVKPRELNVLKHPDAIAMASGAQDVLASVQVVDSLEEALVGVQWSVALSARPRGYSPPIFTPRAAAQQACLLAAGGGFAYVLVMSVLVYPMQTLHVAVRWCIFRLIQSTVHLILRRPCRYSLMSSGWQALMRPVMIMHLRWPMACQ